MKKFLVRFVMRSRNLEIEPQIVAVADGASSWDEEKAATVQAWKTVRLENPGIDKSRIDKIEIIRKKNGKVQKKTYHSPFNRP